MVGLLAAALLAACGQKGQLYLPKKTKVPPAQQPHSTAPEGTPPPASTPAPDSSPSPPAPAPAPPTVPEAAAPS
ncbi:MAG: LPS translocon maturation chaperone LptM [Steroidobacteraceae bacterium]